MKQQSKWFAAALACGLAVTGSAQAQSVMLSGVGTTYVSTYDSWTSGNGGTVSSGTSVGSGGTGGIEVVTPVAGGFGGAYIDISDSSVGAVLLASGDTQATINFTINGTASDYNWMGVPLSLNDNTATASQSYGSIYSGSGNPGNPMSAVWNGNSVSITFALNSAQMATIQGGSDYLYGFNIGVDPAVVSAANLDITFNSLVLSAAPTPEPATLALSGLGMAGLLIFRRRK